MTNQAQNAAVRSHLVTGGAGYLAASLVRELASEPANIRRLFRSGRTPAVIEGGRANVEDALGDVSVRADLERALDGVDVVHHLASQTSVYVAENDPYADFIANVLPMQHLLEICRVRGTRPLVLFAGTVTEVGLPGRLPVDESFPDDPRTLYDLHKLTAERYLKHYARSGVVSGATLRLANVYGPGPRSSKTDRGVLNAMVRRALAGEPLKIYGEAAWVRDYVYVDDVARAFVLAAKHPEAVNGCHFVIGSGSGTSVGDAIRLVAALVEERTGRKVAIEQVEPPARLSPVETRQFVACIDAFRAATGWSPRVTLREGIRNTIDHLLSLENEP